MSEHIKIRIKDYYKDAVGDTEYVDVTKEVYELLENTFRKEANAERIRDYRNCTKNGYEEGDTETLIFEESECLELQVLRMIEIQRLREAVRTLTPSQRERVQLYFFEGLTYRQIAEKQGISDYAVRCSIMGAIKKIKKVLV